MKIKVLERDEFLYSRGDDPFYFYFMIKGRLEV